MLRAKFKFQIKKLRSVQIETVFLSSMDVVKVQIKLWPSTLYAWGSILLPRY